MGQPFDILQKLTTHFKMVCNQYYVIMLLKICWVVQKIKVMLNYRSVGLGIFMVASIRTRESGLVLLIFEAESFVKLTFNITNTKLVLGLRYLVKPSNFTSVGVVIDDES